MRSARGPLALPAGTPRPAPGGAARDAQASPCMLAAAVLQAGLDESLAPLSLSYSRLHGEQPSVKQRGVTNGSAPLSTQAMLTQEGKTTAPSSPAALEAEVII
jgi:hypothetical protein